jgi:phage tail-like protein
MPKKRNLTRLGNAGLNENTIIYVLELEGIAILTVDSISGFGTETQIVEYMNGDDPLTHKKPGRFTYNNITIHNIPIADATPLYNWVELVKFNGGNLDTVIKTVSIVMKNGSTEIRRWNCFGCFPASFTYHKMESGKFLYADMVLAIERFENV